MEQYDMIVVGGGPGGYVAAIRASQLGQRVALVEKGNLGGLCLNWGCIPTKALLRNAEILRLFHRAKEFGITVGEVEADLGAAVARSRRVVGQLVKGVEFLMKKNKVTVLRGTGFLQDSQTVQLQPSGETLQARAIIVATGAKERVLPGLEPDGTTIITSRHALERRELPRRLLAVGGGATGVELAYFYRAYGSEVTIAEMMPHVLPAEDTEVAEALQRALRGQGITILTEAKIEILKPSGEGGGVARVSTPQGVHEVPYDVVLVAVGVEGVTKGFGLEALGVKIERGYVAVNERMETNVPGIYAIGDVTGPPLLAHVAQAQGIVAAEAIAGAKPLKLRYDDMPRAVYCQPQVASIGITEAQATERGYQVSIGRFPYRANGKALGMAETEGFIKVVVDKKTGEVLGAQMLGADCTELLGELSLARLLELTPRELGRAVHPHPTISEALMEATLGAAGEAIHQ